MGARVRTLTAPGPAALFDTRDAEKALALLSPTPLHQARTLGGDISVVLHRAGHTWAHASRPFVSATPGSSSAATWQAGQSAVAAARGPGSSRRLRGRVHLRRPGPPRPRRRRTGQSVVSHRPTLSSLPRA